MKHPQEDGFTLIEVMISILLTAVAVIGIIALYMTETRASSYSRHATEATVLAADKLEKLRTMSVPGANPLTDTVDAAGASPGMYTRTWAVSSGSGADGVATHFKLQVDVAWTEDGSPATKHVVLYGRRGL